jgi:HD-GYP domain-containing protein (c-di-GMP phosphodiesterase class II)
MQSIAVQDQQFDPKLTDLSARMDEVEGYLQPHGVRVVSIADQIAEVFNLAVHDRMVLRQAALIHDVGELMMNRPYLKESRILTTEEHLDMQRHPVIGEQECAKLGLSRGVQLLVRWHHERWNGGGYPDGLEGEQIPLAARILRAADTFAAMTGDRPFRKALSPVDARKYLIEWAGIEFDPRVIKALISIDKLFETERAAGSV